MLASDSGCHRIVPTTSTREISYFTVFSLLSLSIITTSSTNLRVFDSLCVLLIAEAENVFLGYKLGEKGRKSRITDYRNKMRTHLISADPYSGGILPSLTSLPPWPGADTEAHPGCHHIHLPHHSQSCSVQHCTSKAPPANPVL